MLGQEKCVACGRMSPAASSDNTLTTSFGWRVIRVIDNRGVGVVEWRCATCWQKYKTEKAHNSDPPVSGPPRTPRDPRTGDH